VLRENGIAAAIDALKRLASNCGTHLFFETGHVTEGSRWKWQREIRRFFKTDEEHIFFLLQQIEPYVEDFRIVGKFRIHGVRRWLIRIDMKRQAESQAPFGPQAARISLEDRKLDRFAQREGLGREMGVEYFRTIDPESAPLFVKRRPYSNHINQDEYETGQHLSEDWAVRPLGLTEKDELVYPFVDGLPISSLETYPAKTRRIVAAKAIDIFRHLLETPAPSHKNLLLPTRDQTQLADIVDLNKSNLLVSTSADGPFVHLIDFERQSNHYEWKNRVHLGRILIRLRCHLFFGGFQYLYGATLGAVNLLRYQSKPARERIIDRQPSLISFSLAELRSFAGRALIKVFPFMNER
jgi:hypothetical protein